MNLNQIGLAETNDPATLTARMKIQRNRLLADSDWTQLPDNGLSDSDRQAWATYRQALRDFPATWEPSETANFPDPPA